LLITPNTASREPIPAEGGLKMKKVKYATREEALKHISTTNTKVAAAQAKMINNMYDFGLTVNQNNIDAIAYDLQSAAVKKAMAY